MKYAKLRRVLGPNLTQTGNEQGRHEDEMSMKTELVLSLKLLFSGVSPTICTFLGAFFTTAQAFC